jgi:hypothetical protein
MKSKGGGHKDKGKRKKSGGWGNTMSVEIGHCPTRSPGG